MNEERNILGLNSFQQPTARLRRSRQIHSDYEGW